MSSSKLSYFPLHVVHELYAYNSQSNSIFMSHCPAFSNLYNDTQNSKEINYLHAGFKIKKHKVPVSDCSSKSCMLSFEKAWLPK